MRALRLTFAFVYGFALMYFVCIWVAGFMAARQIPQEYFRFFASYGSAGKEVALALLGIALHLLPTLLLLSAGILAATFASKQNRRVIGVAAVLGAASSYCFWLVYFSTLGTNGTWSLSAALAPYFQAPWWAWPNMVAPFLGLALAFLLLPRHANLRAGA